MGAPQDVIAVHRAALFGLGVDSTNRLPVMLDRLASEPSGIFWPVFLATWSCCDRTWEDRDRLLSAMTRHRHGVWLDYAPAETQAFVDQLPPVVRIYRGGSSRRIRNGISWTTDRAVAETFARGHRGIEVPSPVVASARISRGAIFCAFVDRSESEVLVPPFYLERLSVERLNAVQEMAA